MQGRLRGTIGDQAQWPVGTCRGAQCMFLYCFLDDQLQIRRIQIIFSRGRVTIAPQTKPVEMANGASNIISQGSYNFEKISPPLFWKISHLHFVGKHLILITSVAAQHNWISRQLQPGGGKGLWSGWCCPFSWCFADAILSSCWCFAGISSTKVFPMLMPLISGEIHLKGWTGDLGGLNVQVLTPIVI